MNVLMPGEIELKNFSDCKFQGVDGTENKEWASLAAVTLLAFGNKTGDLTVDTAIIDLIANMMHLWEQLGMADFQRLVDMAAIHFESEKDTE